MAHMRLKAAKVRGLGLGIRVSGVGIRPIEGVTCANRYMVMLEEGAPQGPACSPDVGT